MSSPIPFANLSTSQIQDLKNLEEKLSAGSSGNETIVIAYSQHK